MAIETMVGNDILLYVDVAEDTPAAPADKDFGTGNSAFRVTADEAGTAGNSITVAVIDPVGNNASLSVDVTGTAITVNAATDGASAITSTAAQVRDAINADPEASALVTASLPATSNGTGVVAAVGATALDGGAAAVDAPSDFQMIGYQRDISREQNRELIDASHKGSDHTQSVYGRMESTISLDALVPNPAIGAVATHDRLWDAQVNKESFLVQYIQRANTGNAGDDVVRQAEALIGSISEEGPDNDVATISLELSLQEPLTVV